ncbi:hypothetical protein Ccel01_27010 [Cellulosimicrobium cellulans]|uniref:Helix-turn-helix domain-containing protein n=1 Tax=Cellulosimicrobium cellulans TaxID=1710 RepID=A0AAV5PCP6_CELCE|nr:hypothetical protein Ccel01_27010 [Cellulosimicrobium cellulans]
MNLESGRVGANRLTSDQREALCAPAPAGATGRTRHPREDVLAPGASCRALSSSARTRVLRRGVTLVHDRKVATPTA